MPQIQFQTINHSAVYPFQIESSTSDGDWSHRGYSVTSLHAQDLAKTISQENQSQTIRVLHYSCSYLKTQELPEWSFCQPGARPYDKALWTNQVEPPSINQRVNVKLNSLGPGTVMAYAIVEGYLGVLVQLDEETRPDWHKKQNPTNEPSLVFGSELSYIGKDLSY